MISPMITASHKKSKRQLAFWQYGHKMLSEGGIHILVGAVPEPFVTSQSGYFPEMCAVAQAFDQTVGIQETVYRLKTWDNQFFETTTVSGEWEKNGTSLFLSHFKLVCCSVPTR